MTMKPFLVAGALRRHPAERVRRARANAAVPRQTGRRSSSTAGSPAGPASAQPQLTASEHGVILSWLENAGSTTTFKFSQRTATGWSDAQPDRVAARLLRELGGSAVGRATGRSARWSRTGCRKPVRLSVGLRRAARRVDRRRAHVVAAVFVRTTTARRTSMGSRRCSTCAARGSAWSGSMGAR